MGKGVYRINLLTASCNTFDRPRSFRLMHSSCRFLISPACPTPAGTFYCFENTPHPITPSPLPSPLGRGKRGVRVRGYVAHFHGAEGGRSDCHENDDFAQRGTNNCGFFGPKNGPQNDRAYENDDFAHRGTNNCRFFGPKNGPQNDSSTPATAMKMTTSPIEAQTTADSSAQRTGLRMTGHFHAQW
jgi:hypothetical protein